MEKPALYLQTHKRGAVSEAGVVPSAVLRALQTPHSLLLEFKITE